MKINTIASSRAKTVAMALLISAGSLQANANKNNQSMATSQNNLEVKVLDITEKAEKIGVQLNYSPIEKPGYFLPISKIKKLPKNIKAELQMALKPYDDNQNNKLETTELKNFFTDALKAITVHPKGINLTTNIYLKPCKNTGNIDEILNENKSIKNTLAQKSSKNPKCKKTSKDTAIYIYYPRKDQYDLFMNKTVSSKEVVSILSILKNHEKYSLENFDKKVQQEISKIPDKYKGEKSKTPKHDNLKFKLLKPLLNLKTGDKITYRFNILENGEPIKGKIKNNSVFSYTVTRHRFNKIKITSDEIVDTTANKSIPFISKLFSKFKKY